MAPISPQPTATISAMLYSLNDDFLRTCSVPSPYQVREKHLFYGSLPALGIGAASFWSAAEKDRAESPTASPERPKTIHNS